MNFLAVIKKPLGISIILAFAFVSLSSEIFAQDRDRVVKPKTETKKSEQETRPTTIITANPKVKKPTLTNEIVVRKKETPQELVRKTSQSAPTNKKPKTNNTSEDTKQPVNQFYYSAVTRALLMRSINNKIGIRYRLGTQGPNAYDCSGFVWKVFGEAGIPFTRTSARQFWRTFDPVYGDDRFEFGTLVFLNKLGHVGIVADKNGFYHASSSKGITYSKFAGYWEKRIVGFRRIPTTFNYQDSMVVEEEQE